MPRPTKIIPTNTPVRRDAPGDYTLKPATKQKRERAQAPSTCTVRQCSRQAVEAAGGLVRLLGRLGRLLGGSRGMPPSDGSASPSSEVVGLDPPPSPTSPVVLRTRQSQLSSVLAEFRAERRWGVRLGCVREYGARQGPVEGPEGGKLAAGGACEASGRVAGAGGARSAAEGVVWARTGVPLPLFSSGCP